MALSPTITVKCPQCQQIYIAWHIPPVGSPTVGEQSSQMHQNQYQPDATCSKCGHRAVLAELVNKNGILQAGPA